MNEGFADRIVASLIADAESGIRDIVSSSRADLQASISVPVGYASGPRGGLMVIRSKPGEPPRRETGNYVNSWGESVVIDGLRVVGRIYSDVDYGSYLSTGTSRMASRPHLSPAFHRAVDAALARFRT
jgi:hypothetical protein